MSSHSPGAFKESTVTVMEEPNDFTVFADYCLNRLSPTQLTRSGRKILQLSVWDRDREKLDWACEILNASLPRGRTGRPAKVSWQADRQQGAIHITGVRANSLVSLLSPHLKNTSLGSKLAELAS